MAFDDKTICVGCPDAADGCHLACIKVKEEGPRPVEPILETVKKAETMFSRYEITGEALAKVQALREKLEAQQMTVSVIGQFKRGKSTLINTALGESILPVGIVPVTAVVTTIAYGPRAAQIYFTNGAVKTVAFSEIGAYINEQENMDNHLAVERVALSVPSPLLSAGMMLVDTPGVGSFHEKNSEAAYAFVKESDAVVFLLSVDSPINQIEIEFLERTRAYASKFYFAVNKADIVSESDLAAYLGYCRKLIARLMEREPEEIALYPVSAKTGAGLKTLTDNVIADCRQHTAEILDASVKLKLQDVVNGALNQIVLYRSALNMPMEDFDEKFKALEAFCNGLQAGAKAFAEDFGKNPAMLTAQLGEIKNRLAEEVSTLFGIAYHYDLETVDLDQTTAETSAATGEAVTETVFLETVDALCLALNHTLQTIFMHREENAYKVVRRINDLNRLVRSLVRMRSDLA